MLEENSGNGRGLAVARRTYPCCLMHGDIQRILVDEAKIAARVAELGSQISRELEADVARTGAGINDIVLIPIMTGGIVFVADLMRQMALKLSLRVVTVSSYPGISTESKGAKIRGELPMDLKGKHVLVIDDILDSGQTLAVIKDALSEQEPASLRMCVLLRKPAWRRKAEIETEYVGFDIPDEFVVGYGLEYDGYYRNYPAIAVLKQEAVGQ